MNRHHSPETIWRSAQGWVSGRRTDTTTAVGPVRRDTAAPLDGVQVGYDPADPFAVVLRLGGVEWLVCRGMLADALSVSVDPGGDVRMRPEGDEVRITLSSPTGIATVWIPRPAVRSLLVRSHALVPPGMEADRIDWDLLLPHEDAS